MSRHRRSLATGRPVKDNDAIGFGGDAESGDVAGDRKLECGVVAYFIPCARYK
jgi:hypothetical protein